MTLAVIDTNILLIANGQHADVSPECVRECILRLQTIQAEGTVVIDDSYRILGEYQHKTRMNPPKGVGDVFLKWLLRNSGDTRYCHQVALTDTGNETFAEFPDPVLQPEFDAPDRKFAAVANAHADKPPVWQGADSKWLAWWPALQAAGVRVEFICPDDTCHFYIKKFPDQPLPALPTAIP